MQALWIGIDIPEHVKFGVYLGAVTVTALREKPKRIPLKITITAKYLQWRGMIYGMTNRLGWETEGVICDPRAIWKVFDSFGITGAKMIGYWDTNVVVKTTDPNVLATAYVRKGKTLISIANWVSKPVSVKLLVDWKALGLNPDKVKLVAPNTEKFQQVAAFSPNDFISVEPEKG